MESRSGELSSRAKPNDTSGCWGPEGDPCDHSPLSLFIDTILPRAGINFSGCELHAACGGAPFTSESGDPCGCLIRQHAGEDDACRHSPPCQSPLTLRLGGVGTNGNILHVVSGGIHST